MLIPVKAVNSVSELLECYLGLFLVFFGLFQVVWSEFLHGGVLLFCHIMYVSAARCYTKMEDIFENAVLL